jgi:hypothetical protein
MSDGGRFTVCVTDRGPAELATNEPGEATGDVMAQVAEESGRLSVDEDVVMVSVGLALLTALVSDLAVATASDGLGTEIRMSWPVNRRTAH